MSKQDIKLVQDGSGLFDIEIDENGEIKSVDNLETSIETLLFTDARAPETSVPNAINRRGWVGDVLAIEQQYSLGSFLWTLDQSRLDQATKNAAESFAVQALSPLIEAGIAKLVTANVQQDISNLQRQITIEITITTSANLTERFNFLWRNTGIKQNV